MPYKIFYQGEVIRTSNRPYNYAAGLYRNKKGKLLASSCSTKLQGLAQYHGWCEIVKVEPVFFSDGSTFHKED